MMFDDREIRCEASPRRWAFTETLFDLDMSHSWLVFLNLDEKARLGVRTHYGLPWYLPENWELA